LEKSLELSFLRSKGKTRLLKRDKIRRRTSQTLICIRRNVKEIRRSEEIGSGHNNIATTNGTFVVNI
jgi:hypothetical protein